MRTNSFFRDLIDFRYSPLEGLPGDPIASSDKSSNEECNKEEDSREEGMRKTLSPIDRG